MRFRRDRSDLSPARFERFDPRPGGSYRLAVTVHASGAARGKSTADFDIVEVRYIGIPDMRVVQAVDFVSDDPAFAGTMTMTWEPRRGRPRNSGRHHCRRRPRESDNSVRSVSWSAGSLGSSAMTPVTGLPCWTATTVNMSGTVHRCGRPRGSTTTSHASSRWARRWPARCAIARRFPPTSWSFERRRRGMKTPCRTHCAELTGSRAERGVVCESIGAVCALWLKRHP